MEAFKETMSVFFSLDSPLPKKKKVGGGREEQHTEKGL